MGLLTPGALATALEALPEWTHDVVRDALVRDVTFPDFVAAFGFATKVALLAERRDHHPELTVDHRVVRLALRSHDVDGVTERDVRLARDVDALLS